jgi:hypothetical protein
MNTLREVLREYLNGMSPPNGGEADESPNMFLAPALGMIANEWQDFVGQR